jgi:fatty acid desaturase
MAAFDQAPAVTTWQVRKGEGVDRRGSDYAELSRRIRQAGLLDRRPTYYGLKIGLNTALLAAGWIAFFQLGDSWYQLIIAAWLAVAFTQIAFVGHDAGHRQIFRTRRPNDLVGLVHANLLLGVSYGWWVGKHNRHHSHPNHAERDPDIAIGAVAFTADQARARRGLARVMARYQAGLFFPLLLLEAMHLHSASVRALLRGPVRFKRLEALLLLAHVAGYLTAVLLVLSPWRALVFVIVQQGALGLYLGCAFAPNHKGMPVLTERDELDFLRRQVLTSRNVRGGRVVDLVLGGLNYQIEHHLFPSLPRPSLRRAQPLVRAFCLEHGLPYCQSTLLASYAQALGHLHTVGAPLRPAVIDLLDAKEISDAAQRSAPPPPSR